MRYIGQLVCFVDEAGVIAPLVVTRFHDVSLVDGVAFPVVRGAERVQQSKLIAQISGLYIVNIPYWEPDRDEHGVYKDSVMYPKNVWFYPVLEVED